MRPAVLQVGGVKREERVGGRAAPPMLCWLAALPAGFPGDKETDHVLGSRDFQILRKGRHACDS